MRYIVASTVGTDEVHLADGRVLKNQMGGAGVYALAGILSFCPEALVISGVGPDYLKRHGSWYRQNEVSADGLVEREGHTHTTRVTYRANGDRLDEPDIGLEEMRRRDPRPEEIARFCTGDTRGIYTFKHLDTKYLDALLEIRRREGCKLLWEIAEDACGPENFPVVKAYLGKFDVFSINKKEAGMLLGVSTFEEAARRFREMKHRWVYLRQGEKGAVLLAEDKVYHFPIVPGLAAVDPTGCGNASSAAVLYACGEGFHPVWAGAMGSVAAAGIIAQFGVPPLYSPETRKQAAALAEKMARENYPVLTAQIQEICGANPGDVKKV
jgi:sugar/nucleoside kinase (ribokinase family)